jgi:hypothetical protein
MNQTAKFKLQVEQNLIELGKDVELKATTLAWIKGANSHHYTSMPTLPLWSTPAPLARASRRNQSIGGGGSLIIFDVKIMLLAPPVPCVVR